MVGYIGKSATVGNFVKLDSITTSATTTFNLLNGGVAYSPESARHCLVSLNGVIQNPETSFNIVNSTIVFSQALTSDDVIDYILVLGDVMSVGTPSDATVSTAKIVDSAVTTAKVNDSAITTAKINNDAVTVDKLNLVSTGSTPSLEAKGTSGVTEGYIQLNCAENSHGIKLKSPPHSAGANYTLTFPNTDGNANEFLQTNGSGTLTWAEAGGGKVLQVIVGSSSNNDSTSSSSFVATSLTASITPSATSSKVAFFMSAIAQISGGITAFDLYDATNYASGGLTRGLTAMEGNATAMRPVSFVGLLSPNTTSAITYTVHFKSSSGTSYFGRTDTLSNLILMEIGA